MYFVAKKLKKRYNITDERTSLYEAAETWVDALDGREFLGQFFLMFIFVLIDFQLSSPLSKILNGSKHVVF